MAVRSEQPPVVDKSAGNPKSRAQESGRNKTGGTFRSRAVNQEDQNWKDQLLKRVQELEVAQAQGSQQVSKLTAENQALNKEIDRVKLLN